MLHHYLQRGFTDEHILSLSPTQKAFYSASMVLYYEEEAKKYRALTGNEG